MAFIKFVFIVLDEHELGVKMRRTEHYTCTFFEGKYRQNKHPDVLDAIKYHMCNSWGADSHELEGCTISYIWQDVYVVTVSNMSYEERAGAMNRLPYICFDRKLECLNLSPPRMTDDMTLFVNDFLQKNNLNMI